MNTDHLTQTQQELVEEVLRMYDRGQPAHTTLLAADVTPQDRAAVAETFTTGAGSGYLR